MWIFQLNMWIFQLKMVGFSYWKWWDFPPCHVGFEGLHTPLKPEAEAQKGFWVVKPPKTTTFQVASCWFLGRTCFSRWWQLKYFLFSPLPGWGRFPFWRAYFSNGLKPPTSSCLILFYQLLWSMRSGPSDLSIFEGPVVQWDYFTASCWRAGLSEQCVQVLA